MGEALVALEDRALDQLGGQRPGIRIRHDLVIVAVHHERRHREFLQVRREIGLRESDDAIVMRFDAAHHALPPPILNDTLGFLGTGAVVTVERSGRKVYIELSPVIRDLSLKSVEDFFGKTARIGRCFQHQRWDGTNEYGLRYAALTVAPDIAGDLAAAGRVTDMDGIFQVEV